MRLPVVLPMLATLLLAGGCSDPQSVKGSWACTTTHPGGFASKDLFDFSDKGMMTLDSDGLVMHGSYKQEGTMLTLYLLDVPVPDDSGRRVTQQQTLTATIQKKSSRELEMDVSTGSAHHLSSCRRN